MEGVNPSIRRSCNLSARCCTLRRFPQLRGRRLPIKRVIAWAVLLELLDPGPRLLDARAMAGRHPPQHVRRPIKMLEPFGAAAIEALVNCLPDKALKRLDTLPHRKIDDDPRVAIRPRVGGVAAFVDIAPDESGAALGDAVHQGKIIGEIRHARIVDVVANAADIQLRKMMIEWLLHGSYSAATRAAPFASAWRVYSSMRRSISGRKWRSRPCTGHAAPSPKAQMVWPSIWVVTSISMSISRFCARPSAMRSSTRHIQPMPSRHGVHWPQLSCL